VPERFLKQYITKQLSIVIVMASRLHIILVQKSDVQDERTNQMCFNHNLGNRG